MRVRKTFLPKEITTKGSMSQPMRVTGSFERLVSQ
jgi:hypothetical protein